MCCLRFSNTIEISDGARISVQEVECFNPYNFSILRHLCSEDTSKGYQIEIYEDK